MSENEQDYLLVIPVRLGSTRLERKPLADIAGRPMVLRTLDRAREAAPNDLIYVATDSEEIAELCEADGAQAVMTSDKCLTGTDRVAEFAKQCAAKTYINLQGDEPMMDAENIRKIIDASARNKDRIINGWAWIKSEEEFRSRSIPKLAIRQDGRLLYMSRAPIPGTKTDSFSFSRKQVCVYAFPRAALEAFANTKGKAEHEAVEDIEILRFLEMGWDVQMIELDGAFRAVDTPDDLEIVRREFSKAGA